MSDISFEISSRIKNLCSLVSELNELGQLTKDMPVQEQVEQGYADGAQTLIEQIIAEAWIVGSSEKLGCQETKSLAIRLVEAIVADEQHADGCDITAGLFGTELSKLVVELAGLEAKLYAAEDQVEEANQAVEQMLATADGGYSANTIYHVGTDENGRVIARGTRSTSDAHKDFHVMHAALALSQAFELRSVDFEETEIGGLLVRPAVKGGAV